MSAIRERLRVSYSPMKLPGPGSPSDAIAKTMRTAERRGSSRALCAVTGKKPGPDGVTEDPREEIACEQNVEHRDGGAESQACRRERPPRKDGPQPFEHVRGRQEMSHSLHPTGQCRERIEDTRERRQQRGQGPHTSHSDAGPRRRTSALARIPNAMPKPKSTSRNGTSSEPSERNDKPNTAVANTSITASPTMLVPTL